MTVVVDILERYLKLNQWRQVAQYLTGNSTIASIGGSGVATEGGQINTLNNAGASRNILDDGFGNATIAGTLVLTGALSLSSVLAAANGVKLGANSGATGAFACTVNTFYVDCDATSGAFNVTLFHTINSGQITCVKKIDASGNAVTVLPGSGTIDGAANYVLSAQWQSVWMLRFGAQWRIIGVNP